jgi:hypothetical protein
METALARSARTALGAGRRALVPLAIASIGGFVIWAGTMLVYDANGGQGPLAAIGGWPIARFASIFCGYVLGPLIYAVATWRLGLRGAFIALAGVVFLGPALFVNSPWQTVNAEARYGYYDEGRGWIELGLAMFGVGWFLVVPAITLVARMVWRRIRRPVAAEDLIAHP